VKDEKLDEALLFNRKDKFLGYRFCPRCGAGLEEKTIDGRRRLQCPGISCDYIYYHNPTPAAGAIVIQDGRILLVKRAFPPKAGWWCLPAGFMEWSEHPTQTAVRELKEETGLDIKLESLFEVYSGNDDPRTNAVLILYLASVTGGQAKPADDAEEIRFFDFENLPKSIAFKSHRQALTDYREKYLK
jgi:ADP-ribose pyrophosphatase YjhB (NUDIX family)